MAFWTKADFDEHELVEFVHDRKSGLDAILAIHSTHLGPAAGGTRFWHYSEPDEAMVDALRLSRGMSYKNAMAGLPMGGGKAVVLLGPDGVKTPEMLAAFGDAVDALGGRYVTAEDVGATEGDMVAISKRTPHVCGLPAEDGSVGGDPGPFTAIGIYHGIKAAVAHKLRKDSVRDVRVALQGCGSVGGGVARLLAKDGARLIVSDIDASRAKALAREVGGRRSRPTGSWARRATCSAPTPWARYWTRQALPASIARSSPAVPTTSSRAQATARCLPSAVSFTRPTT